MHSTITFLRLFLFAAVHEALDPEYTILKQRLARRLRYEGNDDESVKKLTLSECGACSALLAARWPPPHTRTMHAQRWLAYTYPPFSASTYKLLTLAGSLCAACSRHDQGG